ncbi:ABC-F family ATP-binding cassette domain-containing protein [Sanguibacter antarcticus]|uniref:Macrolide transport system ATP-binding/permease protein n=1 Tax=Sanguibacter antarcticus TaxID=372484 RepID=A0A2A9E8Q1_9MICO|nr:ABC-F family ATP-binding cassette domain-containing protein [Sanguibacter antarcticus]PFG34599.1 macrolide transport system ATP-binding/permease protein [Sanguibacter antarcticus]
MTHAGPDRPSSVHAPDELLDGPAPLVAERLTRYYDGRTVLDAVSLVVAPGHRVGVVGENGAGKSTLLRLLAGIDEPDAGTVQRPDDLGFLHQETPYGPTATVEQVIADALAEVRALEAQVLTAGEVLAALDGDRDRVGAHEGSSADARSEAEASYARALARAEAAEVWDADRRAAVTLAGLGIEHLHGRVVGQMSGGERTRLGLAALLVRQPGALLLDEPTNHLDDDAAEFLGEAVRAMPGIVVLASHDRDFLDEVCTEILDLDPSPTGESGTLTHGAYRDYRVAKKKERAEWQRVYEAEQAELESLRQAVDTTARAVGHDRLMSDRNKMSYDFHGARVESSVSRRVRNAQQRFDVLERAQVRRPPLPLTFAPGPHGLAIAAAKGRVLSVRDVVVPGRLTLARLDVAAGTKLLVTGPNGSGKSTLLHVLAGDIVPARGTVRTAAGVRVALLEQDVYLQDDVRSPRQLFDLLGAARALEGFGLVEDRDMDRPLRELSTGQRRRVVLGMLVAQAPEVLLLDEPTNHISLALAEELGEAIGKAPGTIVAASHDRWLRRTWRGKVLVLSV